MLFRVEQKGSGEPLCFLHGFMGSSDDFTPMLSSFDNPIIIPDFYGHGKSPPPPSTLDFRLAAEAIGLTEPTHIIGYSLGGRIAMALSHYFPQYVLSLTLIGAHPGLTQGHEERAKQHNGWSNRLSALPFDQFLSLWYSQPLFSNFAPDRSQNDPAQLKTVFDALALHKQPNFSHVLDENCLLVAGKLDFKYHSLYQSYQQLYQTDWLSVPNCGHSVHLQKPRQLIEALWTKF